MEMFLTDIKELYTILNTMFPKLNFYFIPQNDHHTGTQALQHQLWKQNNSVLCVTCCYTLVWSTSEESIRMGDFKHHFAHNFRF